MIYWFGLLFALMTQAFFAGCETGFISLQRPRIRNARRKGSRNAAIIELLLRKPSLTLAVTLLGTNLCIVFASLFAEKAASGLHANICVVPLVLTMLMLSVEIIPKNWFRQAPDERLMIFAPLLYAAYIVLFFPALLLSRLTEWIARQMTRGRKTEAKDTIMLIREDFRLLVRDSESEGIIDSEAADILDRAVDFYKLTVADIMTPESQVKFIHSNATVLDAVQMCRRHNISRMPVTLDSGRGENRWWIGIFNIYDVISNLPEEQWPQTKVAEAIMPAGTVFADENVADVLVKAKAAECPLLIVTDRENRRLGIVTPIDVSRRLFA